MKKGMNVMVYNGRSSPESSPQPSRTLLKQDSRRYIGPAPSARKTPMKIASITEDEEMVYSREAERALEEADGAVFQRYMYIYRIPCDNRSVEYAYTRVVYA